MDTPIVNTIEYLPGKCEKEGLNTLQICIDLMYSLTKVFQYIIWYVKE